eukprot:gene8278-8465_t
MASLLVHALKGAHVRKAAAAQQAGKFTPQPAVNIVRCLLQAEIWQENDAVSRLRKAGKLTGVLAQELSTAVGERWHFGPMATRLAQSGVVVAVISYTLYPEALAGQMAGEVLAALLWTMQHIQSYGGDPSRIHVVGHSAGTSQSRAGSLGEVGKLPACAKDLISIVTGVAQLGYDTAKVEHLTAAVSVLEVTAGVISGSAAPEGRLPIPVPRL